MSGCVALSSFLIPFQVIQPSKIQEESTLLYSLLLKQWAPTIAILSAILSLWAARRLGRWAGYLCSLTTIIFAGLNFINHFELMYHPIDKPQYIGASEARLDDEDMLLTVKLGGESRAYPVRTLAYHHLVNDQLSGVPIVATY